MFDLNGTLVSRTMSAVPTTVTSKSGISFIVSPRPHLIAFLERMLETFHVAVFSSATQSNTSMAVRSVFNGLDKRLEFIWGRDHTMVDFVAGHGRKNFKTVKDVNKVWKISTLWKVNNTILIDDTESKGRLCRDNLIVAETFTGINEFPEDTYLDRLEKSLLKTFTLEDFPPFDPSEADMAAADFVQKSRSVACKSGDRFKSYKVDYITEVNASVPGDVRPLLKSMTI